MALYFVGLLFFSSSLLGSEEPLRVGMELSYPPFESISREGRPEGISVDIAEALGKSLKRPVYIENISYYGLIPSLNNGKIDIILSSMTITPEREKAVEFSKPYAKTGLCLLVHSGSSIQTVEDLNHPGRTVVVKLGTSGELYADKHLKEATVRVLDKEGMCVLEVIQGKADAFIYDQLSVYRNWQRNPRDTKALLKAFQEEDWGIAVRKGDQSLLNRVNAFIDQFQKEGGFNKLAEKYLPEEKAAFEKQGIPFIL